MNIDPALLAAVVRDPDDLLAWGVLADWLDEHDQPLRAHAIRLQLPDQVPSFLPMQTLDDFYRDHGASLLQRPLPVGRITDLKWSYGFPVHCEVLRVVDDTILGWLAAEPILRSIHVQNVQVSPALIALFQRMPALEVLKFQECELDFPIEMLAGLPQVVKLVIDDQIDDPAYAEVEATRLAAFASWSIDDQRARAKCWAAARCRRLRTMEVYRIEISMFCGDPPLVERELIYLDLLDDLTEIHLFNQLVPGALVNHLHHLRSLKTLRLGCNIPYTGSDFTHLGDIPTLPALTHLHLAAEVIESTRWDGLETMHQLSELSLGYGELSEAVIDHILPLIGLRSLALTDLMGEGWTPETLARLSALPGVKQLALGRTEWLTPEHLRSLITWPAIEELSLRGSDLDDSILPILESMPHLRRVNLEYTQVSAEAVNDLAERRPDLAIEWTNFEAERNL